MEVPQPMSPIREVPALAGISPHQRSHQGFLLIQLVKHLPGNAGDARDVALTSWRRKWQPTPVFLPGKFCGQGSLVSYSAWGYKESDTTKHTPTHPHPHSPPHCSHHVQARAVSSLQAACSRHKSKSESRMIACSLLQNT